jgi:hypothetical protein
MATTKAVSGSAKRLPKSEPGAEVGKSPAELIDARIHELQDWRGETLTKVRAVILAADPQIIEEWKWNGPVWSCSGIICTGETYKKAVKLTFAKGAQLDDPTRLFNSSLEGNTRRAIDLLEGSVLHEAALAKLVQAATAQNRASASAKASGAV